MAATVLTGTGPISYTNSTGGNVRVIVMSCETSGITNILKPGSLSCGSISYEVQGGIKWGKGVPVQTGSATTSIQKAAEMPYEFMLANGDIFSLANAPTESVVGQQLYENEDTDTQPNSESWTCPSGVSSVCVVCVGGGSRRGKGGALAWKNHIPVTAGQNYSVQIGAGGRSSGGGNPYPENGSDSYFIDKSTVWAQGGQYYHGSQDSEWVGDGGGKGKSGAGGYMGDGGESAGNSGNPGSWGQGGGGGGSASASSSPGPGGGGGGGGVGLNGMGLSGQGGGTYDLSMTHGYGGSNGARGPSGKYGGGGAQDGSDQNGGAGGVRIIWGQGRAFPDSNTTNNASGDDTVIAKYNILVIPEGN